MSQRTRKPSYWQDAPMPRHQIVLFQETLESRIPSDHPVRILDEILDRLDWNDFEALYHGTFGQPPIHPSVLCKVILFGLTRRIRSSRQLEYNVKHSIDFIWLSSGRTFDHSTLSDFRRKHQKQLKGIYKQLVQTAIGMGVAKLSELCIDGTRVLADASRFKRWTQENVAKVIEQLDREIETALGEVELNDQADSLFDDGQRSDQLPSAIADLKTRREQLDAIMGQLKEMDAARKAKGKDRTKNPAQIPKTDTDARVLPNKEGGYAPNYTPMAVTETENGFIVGAEVVIGNVEHTMLLPMVDQIIAEFGAEVVTVMGDGAYSAGENLRGCEQRELELLSPIATGRADNPADRSDLSEPVAAEQLHQLPIMPQTKCFDKSAFVYDEQADCYYCPAGKRLDHSGTEKKRRSGVPVTVHNYVCGDSADCAMASQCKTNPSSQAGRKVSHDEYEGERDRQRARMRDQETKTRYKQRSHYGETPFAVLKATMDLRRFLLRGIEGVRTEWLWGCTAFNMKKLMTLIAKVRAQASEMAEPSAN
jgi:transposase